MYCRDTLGIIHSKAFIPTPPMNSSAQIHEWRRYKLTRLMTEHCLLGDHISNIGLQQTLYCQFCNMEDKSTEKILCICSTLERTKFQTVDIPDWSLATFKQVSANSTMVFIKRRG